jgi:methyl-accepting chemotaxis protein
MLQTLAAGWANGRAKMNETTLLIAFIAVTAVAVVLQTLILAGMFVSVRKMIERTESVQQRVNEQLLPLLEKVRGLVDESAPKIRTVMTNVAETSDLVKSQAVKIDGAVTEIVGLARNQAERANGLASRTMERVDHTATAVQNAVTAPVRHLSGLAEGVLAGIGQLIGGRRERGRTKAVPNDDMFI